MCTPFPLVTNLTHYSGACKTKTVHQPICSLHFHLLSMAHRPIWTITLHPTNGVQIRDITMNLVETIKSLKKYVQSYKVVNERLTKSKEQQDGFNIKLLQILDIIEKKMDKETESRNLGSHKSHDKRRESRSVYRHHHHSPMNSSRRAHSSSSPSLIKKHKRRSRVDELQGEKNKIKPPTFDGEHKKYEDAKTWLLFMRKYFQLHNYSS
jgi:hypothetical protein